MLAITKDSHLDHDLTLPIIQYILSKLGNKKGFFINTVTLPKRLGSLPCRLYGPAMGDRPIPEDEVRYIKRAGRPGKSRMIDLPPRPTQKLTVIAGPYGDFDTVLYTTFGGPQAPREPFDPDITDPNELAASEAFWSQHALSIPPDHFFLDSSS